jgi:hypothetical protein
MSNNESNSMTYSAENLYNMYENITRQMRVTRTPAHQVVQVEDQQPQSVVGSAQACNTGEVLISGSVKLPNNGSTSTPNAPKHLIYSRPTSNQGLAFYAFHFPNDLHQIVYQVAIQSIFDDIGSIVTAAVPLANTLFGSDDYTEGEKGVLKLSSSYSNLKGSILKYKLTSAPGIIKPVLLQAYHQYSTLGSTESNIPIVLNLASLGKVIGTGLEFSLMNIADSVHAKASDVHFHISSNYKELCGIVSKKKWPEAKEYLEDEGPDFSSDPMLGSWVNSLSDIASSVVTALPAVLNVAKTIGAVAG